ncbi:hypothetical protein [Galactobacter valiniphilus]|uniref:hypothetical protein n=1 Tax=Galactobacter valiniphilus TaxID=2676122 RepID=UPI0011C3C75F|nr:hypothetical protein [Galactobacter valiniphilus]
MPDTTPAPHACDSATGSPTAPTATEPDFGWDVNAAEPQAEAWARAFDDTPLKHPNTAPKPAAGSSSRQRPRSSPR